MGTCTLFQAPLATAIEPIGIVKKHATLIKLQYISVPAPPADQTNTRRSYIHQPRLFPRRSNLVYFLEISARKCYGFLEFPISRNPHIAISGYNRKQYLI